MSNPIDKKTLMQKKISDITAAEKDSLAVVLGSPGLPFPMGVLRENAEGLLEETVGVMQTSVNPLVVYSHMDMERVVGEFFRDMMTPSMMTMERDLLLLTAPESRGFLMTIFGDASSGKSHLFRKIGRAVHPQGCITVDCGGMNMRELFYRTVLDYGNGVREQLDEKMKTGKVSQSALELLEDEFPGSVIDVSSGGQEINWEAVGQRRTKEDNGKKVCTESYGEAVIRAKSVLEMVYMKSGISVQNNAFGIKTVPGEVFEAYWSGRPLFLDEFNKSKAGTLDTFQTFLQFANGEVGYDTIQIYNSMATDGDDQSPKLLELNRKDRKVGFFIGIAGNDTSDGMTTQQLSYSMETRLNIRRIGAPQLRDWEHRISQVWTGLPINTLYNLREMDAKAKPAEFADWLLELRTAGLSSAEISAIPEQQLTLLQNFDKAVLAFKQMADYYHTRLQLSDTSSSIYDGAKAKAYRQCEDEISAKGQRIAVSFRKVILNYQDACRIVPEVIDASKATWGLSLKDSFNRARKTKISHAASLLSKLGANIVRVIREDIANDTNGMPETQRVLLRMCKETGIFDPEHKQASNSDVINSLADLLTFDTLAQYGGAEKLKEVRGVIMAHLKAHYDNIAVSDDEIIPLESLGATLKKLKDRGLSTEQSFVMPNDDINSVSGVPVLEAQAIPNYELFDPATSDDYELVDYRAALAGLAMPGYAEENLKRIWPADLETASNEPPDSTNSRHFKILMGQSEAGLDFTILSVANSNGEQDYMYLLRGKELGKSMLIGQENIPDDLKSALSRNNISYVWNNDPDVAKLEKITREKKGGKEVSRDVEVGVAALSINAFMSEWAEQRTRSSALNKSANKMKETKEAITGVILAFTAVSAVSPAIMKGNIIEDGTTLGELLNLSKPEEAPEIFTSIVKPRIAR
jgi:hypothetical protein